MSEKDYLKKYLRELIDEVEKELDESTATAAVDGYQTPHAFSSKKHSQRRKKTATQAGYAIVDGDVENITEELNESIKYDYPKLWTDLKTWSEKNKYPAWKHQKDFIVKNAPKYGIKISDKDWKHIFKVHDEMHKKFKLPDWEYDAIPFIEKKINALSESLNEGRKSKTPVNRWLELKNDETKPNKKLAIGLKELKYKLREIEKFLSWYNKISKMNELSSDSYWKRTHRHIYKIKERLVNIAHTIKELEQ